MINKNNFGFIKQLKKTINAIEKLPEDSICTCIVIQLKDTKKKGYSSEIVTDVHTV